MRLELLYKPRLLCERLAIESQRRRRLEKLKGTVAEGLKLGHIDSLELLEITKSQRPQVIYDVGANVGTWSLLANACLPDATIHAFEPLVVHHAQFENMTQNLPSITLHKIALGASAGTLNMQVTSFSDASSLLEIAEPTVERFGITKKREEKVAVVRLDEYVAEHNMPLPDVIKLDVQGYELEAMCGGEHCLSHAKFVICEVSFLEFYHGQALFHDIVEYLHRHQFYLKALAVNTPLGQELSQTDTLFVRHN